MATDDDLDELDSLAGDPPDVAELEPETEPDQPDDYEEEAEEERPDVEEPDLVTKPTRPAPAAPSRREKRIQALSRQVSEQNRRIDDLLRAQRQPVVQQLPMQPQESPAQREARRSQLSPEERVREDMRDSEERMSRQFGGWAQNQADSSDRAIYETKAAINPTYKRWQSKVEETRQQLYQREGRVVDRETILRWVIGDAMLAQAGKPSRQQQQAERRVKANTTRPSSGGTRSDTQSARRQSSSRSLEDRLADQPL